MRERTFRVPSARELLDRNSIPLPRNYSNGDILDLLNQGYFEWAGQTTPDAVINVESLKGKSKTMVLFPETFNLTKDEINKGIKSLDWLLKIDSQRVMRALSTNDTAPTTLTREFLEFHLITPEKMMKVASENIDPYNPPVGFYWIRSRGQANVITPYRCATAAEMKAMRAFGEFPNASLIDHKFYGSNTTLAVSSRTEQGVKHQIPLIRLPVQFTPKQDHSSWVNIMHKSNDPDARYFGDEHERFKEPTIFWSTPAIYAFYESDRLLLESGEGKRLVTNPFPIPTEEMVDFLDDLRLKCLIVKKSPENGKFSLDVLYKAQMDRLLMARTGMRQYQNCWFHSGKRDTSYLFKPTNQN